MRMRPITPMAAAAVSTILLAATCDDASPPQSDKWTATACSVVKKASVIDRVHTIDAENGSCELIFRASGVTLETSEVEGIDVKGPVIRSSAGEYYAASYSGYVNRWSHDGTFMGHLGKRGPGPYAYRSASGVLIDRTDTVHVSDLPGRWHVLGDSGQIVRTIQGPSLAVREGVAFLDDGRVLLAVPNPPFSDLGKRYVLVNRQDGSVLTSFDQRASSDALRDARHIAYAGGNRFWTVSPTRYELELWTTEGKRLGGIRRRVSWFRESNEGLGATSGNRIASISLDSTGILWVLVINFREAFEQSPDASPSERYSTHVEAFNSYTGELLISRPFNNPLAFYPGLGPNLAYAAELDANGLVTINILEYRLVTDERGP